MYPLHLDLHLNRKDVNLTCSELRTLQRIQNSHNEAKLENLNRLTDT